MRQRALAVALLLAGAPSALAFDADSQAVLDRMKSGKLMPISDVAVLMMGSERWCYNERAGECSWSDIYLSTDAKGAVYEISNPWSEEVDISFVDEGVFRDDRYICEIGHDWITSVRAYGREDGNAIEGRALATLKDDIRAQVTIEGSDDCFDYVYRGADPQRQIVTLLQRQYVDGETNPADDAVVSLYFDKDAAEALGWYW